MVPSVSGLERLHCTIKPANFIIQSAYLLVVSSACVDISNQTTTVATSISPTGKLEPMHKAQ